MIGLSLISGLLVRVSAPFGIMLMLLYWTAHMDFPYIENVNSYLVDYHIVYAGVLVYLIVKHAGHVFGLDGWVAKLASVQQAPALRWDGGLARLSGVMSSERAEIKTPGFRPRGLSLRRAGRADRGIPPFAFCGLTLRLKR